MINVQCNYLLRGQNNHCRAGVSKEQNWKDTFGENYQRWDWENLKVFSVWPHSQKPEPNHCP